jgi:transcriptional regulator with XRE-family HTH domain
MRRISALTAALAGKAARQGVLSFFEMIPPPTQPMSFGALLRHLRVQRGWTQAYVAERAGITLNAVSNLEREVAQLPNADTVERLAAVFDMAPEELDSRWLGDRVVAEARSLAQRQAIQHVLTLDETGMKWMLDRLAEMPKKTRRKPRRRR